MHYWVYFLGYFLFTWEARIGPTSFGTTNSIVIKLLT